MKVKPHWFLESIKDGMRTQTFSLDHQNIFRFRLMDNAILLRKLAAWYKADSELKNKIDNFGDVTDYLKNIKLWMRTEEESVISMTLFDIYCTFERYLKDSNGEDYLFNSYDISFVGSLGPFQTMSAVECINEDLLNRFLFYRILKNKIPSRALRLRTNQNIMATFGHGNKFKTELKLVQVTDTGLLFKTKDDFMINNMSSGDYLKFFMKTDHLASLTKNNFKMSEGEIDQILYTRDELKYFQIEEEKILKSLSFQSAINNDFYLFCRYQHILDDAIPKHFGILMSELKTFLQAS